MLQHEAQGTDRRVVGGKLMVVEIGTLRCVFTAHIDDGDRGISEVGLRSFAPDDGDAVDGHQETAGEEFVFVGAAWMSEDEGEGHEWGAETGITSGEKKPKSLRKWPQLASS
jgi:hypothetical protein